MAFLDFDDLARTGLKRSNITEATVVVRTEFNQKQSPSTLFRFSNDLIERVGWVPGNHRIKLQVDYSDRVVKASIAQMGGYKLTSPPSGSCYVKFTVAKGMPITKTPIFVRDVVVFGGEIMLVLPQEIEFYKFS